VSVTVSPVDLELRYQRERRRREKAERKAARMADEVRRFRNALQQIKALERDWKKYDDVTGDKVADRALQIAKGAHP